MPGFWFVARGARLDQISVRRRDRQPALGDRVCQMSRGEIKPQHLLRARDVLLFARSEILREAEQIDYREDELYGEARA